MRAIAAILICLGLAASLGACQGGGGNSTAGGGSATAAKLPDTMDLGNPAAKITVNEFASLGCPICAKWNNEVFQSFKTKYIDTGKVHYVLHEFLTGDQPVAAAGFLLARCAGKDKYFTVADAVFRQEAPLLESDQNAAKRDALLKIAQSLGMTDAQFESCVGDSDALTALNKRSEDAAAQYKIDSTPTFIIGGADASKNQTLTGYQDLPAIDKAIAAAGG
jgi:protein-disulfide isomerase